MYHNRLHKRAWWMALGALKFAAPQAPVFVEAAQCPAEMDVRPGKWCAQEMQFNVVKIVETDVDSGSNLRNATLD